MFTCSKLYSDIPFAHRQHNHGGHCALIHGHNWGFQFTFACDRLDACGFVVDFGDLKWLKDYIAAEFDHKLVLNTDDPELEYLRKVLVNVNPLHDRVSGPFAAITVVPNCGAEGLAEYLFEEVDRLIRCYTKGRVFLVSVLVFEDSKNTATYSQHSCGHAK